MSWTRMNMVVHVGLMILVQLGINHSKGSDLSFVINGERSGQNHASRKSGNQVVQVNHGISFCPKEGPGSQPAARLAYDLAETIDAKCLSVMASRERADRLHAGAARPDKGAHAPRPFRCA